jgi:aspartyl protease family protein
MPSMSDLDTGSLLFLIGWALFIAIAAPGVLGAYRGRLSKSAYHVAVWLGLFLALVTGWTYRDTFESIAAKVSSELVPSSRPVDVTGPDGERAVRIRLSSKGHFYARTMVDGTELTMLVDTGASSVVLKSADAERAGIDVKGLAFTVPVDTANGSTFCAPIRLKSIGVGGITFSNVEALVARPGDLKGSLLGMSFLKRLRSYDFKGDFLTLRS